MTKPGLDLVQSELLSLLSHSLRGEKYLPSEKLDWQSLFDESVSQSVQFQAFGAVSPETELPSEIKEASKSYAYSSFGRNMEIHSQHGYLHKLMTENKIEYCILKGSASARYYRDPVSRTMGDVDFLVKEEDFDRAADILKSEGFTEWEEKQDCHVVFSKDDMHFEMHFEPSGFPEGEIGKKTRAFLNDIFEKSELVDICGINFKAPSDFHHGLIILIHMNHHLLSEGIGLRHLCDFAVFADKFDDETFTKFFKDKLSDCGLWRFAQVMGLLSCEYLEISYREWMGEKNKELTLALILDIFSGGNFGRKDDGRMREGKLISNRGKNGVTCSNILQIISYMNQKTAEKYAIFSKIRIFKPFGWIFWGISFAAAFLRGKKKKVKRETFLNAKRRKDIYKELKIFETEELSKNTSEG